MNDEKKLAIKFMVISLGMALVLIALMLPGAQISQEALLKIDTPQNIEEFDQLINMGPDYGELSVIDLMGFYIENPPQQNITGAAPKRHFGGC